MMTAKEIKDWLNDVGDDTLVGIGDGGLSLETAARKQEDRDYLEVGGIPDEKDDYWTEDPGWPMSDWRDEVQAGDTLLGYHEWVKNQKELHGEGGNE